MLILHDPDEWEAVSSQHTCVFHQMFPGEAFAGCTCSVGYGQRRRDPAEVSKIKAEKQRQHEEKILAEADAIRARRNL